MTEKRFTSNNGVFYTDNETGWEFKCYGEVVDLLNELATKCSYLENENEQLKFCSDKLQKELIKKVEEKAKLKTVNQGLQFKIIDMLDFVKDKGTVTREEIKEWWNNSQRGDNLCIGYVAREDK